MAKPVKNAGVARVPGPASEGKSVESEAGGKRMSDEVVKAYLASLPKLPGRRPLVANGYEKFGDTLATLPAYTHPLIVDSGVEGYDYGIAGTCFLARYRGELFVITAKHCLASSNGNDVRIALNPRTKSFLPLKQLHRAENVSQDFADIAIFEAAPELLEPSEQDFLTALDFDTLKIPDLKIGTDAKLIVPGFPKYLNEVDFDERVLHTQRYVPSARYRGSASRPGIHGLEFDELEAISWPDGMSGSPVLFIEEYPQGHCFGLLGMLIKAGHMMFAEFIGADVLYYMLDRIIAERARPVS